MKVAEQMRQTRDDNSRLADEQKFGTGAGVIADVRMASHGETCKRLPDLSSIC